MKTTKQYISLREIGRRLDIPPSTVVYYKDRFRRFIPSTGAGGRRTKYPPEAVDIFKGIREMYENNWSAEQIEQELALQFGEIVRRAGEQGGQGFQTLSPQLMQTLSGVLEKFADMEQSQQVYRGEIAALQGEVKSLSQRLQERDRAHAGKVESLEHEIASLRLENDRLSDYIAKRVKRDNPLHTKPNDAFLRLPLVICSARGEFLGVAGAGSGHFSSQNFISLIQRSAGATRSVAMEWDKDRQYWILRVRVQDRDREQNFVFMLRQTLTPSKNLVARLETMIVDGNEVPEPMLLSLFRKIKESFNA